MDQSRQNGEDKIVKLFSKKITQESDKKENFLYRRKVVFGIIVGHKGVTDLSGGVCNEKIFMASHFYTFMYRDDIYYVIARGFADAGICG